MLKAAHWTAARYGLSGELIEVSKPRPVPAERYLQDFLTGLRPALAAEGDWQQVSEAVEAVLQHGNGASRQRRWFAQMGEWPYVVDRMIRETATFLILVLVIPAMAVAHSIAESSCVSG